MVNLLIGIQKRSAMIVFMVFLFVGASSNGFSNEAAKVILLETMTMPLVQEHSEWFIKQMSAMGYEQGKNFMLIRLNGDGSTEKINTLLEDTLKKNQPDLVVTNATLASKVAKRRLSGTMIPLLFFGVSDPVGSGLIEAIGKPSGTNITGKSHSVPRDMVISIVMQIVNPNSLPRPVRFGYVYADYPSSNGDFEKLQEEARLRKDVVFVPYKLPYIKGKEGKTAMLKEALVGINQIESEIDFWWQPRGPLGISPDFTKLLIEQSHIPIIYGATLKSAKMGAVINISASPEAQGRETAILADAILKGKNPGEIPPTWSSQLQVAVNLTTSTQLRLTIPSGVLKMASRNIFH
jgi:putative ABC transport system substrate-binding protein